MSCSVTSKKLCDNEDCDICFNKSFASNPKSTLWSNKNALNPRRVSIGSKYKYWFLCNICQHEFMTNPMNVCKSKVNACGYCKNKILCTNPDCTICFDKSFASHAKHIFWDYEKNYPKSPRDVFKASGHKYYFRCPVCEHSFKKIMCNLTRFDNGYGCIYCAGQKLCKNEFCSTCFDNSFEAHHRSSNWDFLKNYPITPRDVFRNVSNRYWFICDRGHSFNVDIKNITRFDRPTWCPYCIHKTETKLLEWLHDKYPTYTIIPQVKFQWCIWESTGHKCIYDFYIRELKLIIELDGGHHFRQISNWENPINNQQRDIFKMLQAKLHSLSVIRIKQEDVLNDRNEWDSKLEIAIKKYETPEIIYIGDNYDIYETTIALMNIES